MGGGRQEPGMSSQGGALFPEGWGWQVQRSAGDGSRHKAQRGWESHLARDGHMSIHCTQWW